VDKETAPGPPLARKKIFRKRPKRKKRPRILFLAVILSILLFAFIAIFTEAFYNLFFSSLMEEKKDKDPGIIWLNN
jgi:hypothetical protein